MDFENVTDNPQESTIVLTILGLLFAQGLNAINTGVLGRIFFYLGEVLTTISVFMVAKEAAENVQAKQVEASTEDENVTKDVAKTDEDSIKIIIGELRQQNQYLQDQIWALQEELLTIKMSPR